jgi:phospholipase C
MMFENRSFDHILGAMPGVNGLFDSNGKVKEGIYNSPDPLDPNATQQVPFPIAPGVLEQTYIVNGDHDFTSMLTDLAGPGTTGVINGQPQNNPSPTYPSINSGFVYINNEQKGGNGYPVQYPVMSYFEWGSMKVFHTLASQFVVCDNWFCDMPGHTAPNRAFMHCATTGDLQIDDTDAANEQWPSPPGAAMVNTESIFERLETFGNTWKMYIPGDLNYINSNNLDTDYLNPTVASQYWETNNQLQTNCTDVPLSQFCTDANAGNLPTYSFIMCWDHPNPDTSMHPSTFVEAGENLLAGVYNTLKNSPCWNDTLLVVNFDENGGLYDHVVPPKVTPPNPGDAPQTTYLNGQAYSFDYSMLGFRIPVILISPWLQAGIESQQLQNTSILRFLQDQFCDDQSSLTQRDATAPSIQAVFDDFGLSAARTDCPDMQTYANNPYQNGICDPQHVSEDMLQAPPADYMVVNTLDYLRGLPGHRDSWQRIKRHFNTRKELMDYAIERKKAAKEYFRAGRLA